MLVNKYCECEKPEIEGNNLDGYYCLKCNYDIEYEPDVDLEYDRWAELDEEARMEGGGTKIT